jgi:hypothetical protein
LGVLKVGAAQKFLGFDIFESGRKVKKPRKSGQMARFENKSGQRKLLVND